MSPFMTLGLLLTDDGIVVIHENWPGDIPMPRIVVIDEAECHYPKHCVLHTISEPGRGLTGRELFPVAYLRGQSLPSPCEVLQHLDAHPETEYRPAPVRIARLLRQRIQELDAQLNSRDQIPTGDDYNQLHQLTYSSLIELLKALGDRPDGH